MIKSFLIAVFLTTVSAPCAFAEGWADSSAGTGSTTGNTSFRTGSEEALRAGRGYELQRPGNTGPSRWTAGGYATRTTTNAAITLPTVTGMPIIKDGVNTFVAPGNLAQQTQLGADGALVTPLPKTGTGSFVWEAMKHGAAQTTYADESLHGPPPLNNFTPIESGIRHSGLTTGHKSDAPPASETPMRYNSSGGMIQGDQ